MISEVTVAVAMVVVWICLAACVRLMILKVTLPPKYLSAPYLSFFGRAKSFERAKKTMVHSHTKNTYVHPTVPSS